MRIVFAGTPSIAVPSLNALSREHEIVAVLTAPDNPLSKKSGDDNAAVKTAAGSLGLKVFQPQKLDADLRAEIEALQPDLLVCFAYGMIFGPKFLALFPKGGINIHPSLLPEFRGPSPISAAILAGLKESGISVQKLALEMDAGDILLQEKFALSGTETTESLSEFCSGQAAPLAVRVVANIESGREHPVAQDHRKASYCKLIVKSDGFIDWTKSAVEIERMIRAYRPWPIASTNWESRNLLILESRLTEASNSGLPTNAWQETNRTPAVANPVVPGTVLKVDKARGILIQTGSGLLAVRRLQLQGKKEMDFQSFVNGARNFLGSLLGGQLP